MTEEKELNREQFMKFDDFIKRNNQNSSLDVTFEYSIVGDKYFIRMTPLLVYLYNQSEKENG
mgnify:CR=1 FL=1